MPEGPGNADVKIRLVTEDAATITVEQLREALRGGNKELEEGHKHTEHLGSELLKAELYVDLFKEGAHLAAEGIHQAYEMAERLADASLEAADEMNQQVRASAGLMSMMDRGAHSMQEIREYAGGVREELAAAGTAAGVSTGQMQEMFDRVIERGNRSTEEAKDLTAQMALVGKVVPQGMEGLAQGFNMMELGIVRARNPLVQLIASTGVLKGNAHAVAAAMQRMTPAEQVEKATMAIERQADILKRSGSAGLGMPTMPEIKASLGNIREGFLEAVGQPLLQHVIPPLAELRDYLMAHAEEIHDFAEQIGQKVAGVIDVVVGATKGIYQGVVKNWAYASEEFHRIFGEWEGAWDYATEHTDEIRTSFEGIAKTIIDAFESVSKVVKAAAEVAMDLNDNLHLHNAGTTRAQIAQEAVASASDQSGPKSQAAFDLAIAKYRQLASEANFDSEAVDKWTESMRDHHAAVEKAIDGVQSATGAQDTDYLSKSLQSSLDQKNDIIEGAILNVIGSSDAMTHALMDGSIHVAGGLDALQSVIDDKAPELAKKMKAFNNSLTGRGIAGQGPSVNFYGASFNIKQDFRDQDPDRIMRVFRSDLGASALSRRQARTSTAFGL